VVLFVLQYVLKMHMHIIIFYGMCYDSSMLLRNFFPLTFFFCSCLESYPRSGCWEVFIFLCANPSPEACEEGRRGVSSHCSHISTGGAGKPCACAARYLCRLVRTVQAAGTYICIYVCMYVCMYVFVKFECRFELICSLQLE
jgi:hypothetical protein